MNNKHISNTTEARSEGILNNGTENESHATMNFCFSETNFDDMMNTIKKEKVSLYHYESSDSEDSASIAYKSIDSKNKKQQDEMCELASTSYEKDANVYESNSQEFTVTKLVDSKILRRRTRSPSTALPIMKILSSKSGPHTCLESCFKCNKVFRVFDNPLHIRQMRNIYKQNEFLKIEPSLCFDSCLCGFCWRQLENTYKSKKSKKKREESYSEKKSRLLERYVKKKKSKNQRGARKCSLHLCSQPNCHKLSVNEYENLKKLFSTIESSQLVFAQSTIQTVDFLKFPFCLCKVHNYMIMVLLKCQICGEKLNAPFNTDDWSMYKKWNIVLIDNNLPLILKPGMFICVTCKGHISKANPGFSTIELPRLREYILESNTIRLKLYGKTQYNWFNIGQRSTYAVPPIFIPNIEEEKECVRSTDIIFSDPSTTNDNIEIGCNENNTESITSSTLLNIAEQNLSASKLETNEEGLDFVKSEEEYFKTYTANIPKDQLHNLYADPTPHTSGIEMTNSLNRSVDDTSDNISSEQNYSATSTDDNNSNNFYDCFSNVTMKVVVGHDDTKDYFRMHVDHQLNNNDSKIYENEEINHYLGSSNDNSLQNVCKIEDVEIDENESEIIGSRQVVSGQNEIENNQSKLNSHAICTVFEDRSSMNLKDDNQCMNEVNTFHKTICLNKTDNSIYSFIAAVEPPNEPINTVPIKRKQSNAICDTICVKDVKKQKLNEKYSSYDNNSTDDTTTTSYKNENITRPLINLSSILSKTYKCKNRYDPMSDISASDSVSDSETFSEIDSDELSTNLEVDEKDYIIIASDDDLGLDSDCKLVKSDLEIKPDHDIKIDCIYLSDSETSLDGEVVLNGKNILDYYTTPLDSVEDSNCEKMPDAETVSFSDYTDDIIATPYNDLSLDSDSKLVKSDMEIKQDYEIEIDCISLSNSETSLDGKVVLNSENILDTNTTPLDSVKHSNCENMPDAETELVSDAQSPINISVNEDEFYHKMFSIFKILSYVLKESDDEILLNSDNVFEAASWSDKGTIKYTIISDDEINPSSNKRSTCIIISDNNKEFKKVINFTIASNSKIIFDDLQGLKMLDIFIISKTNNDSQLKIRNSIRHSFPYREQTVNEDGDAKQDGIQEYFNKMYSAIRCYLENTENHLLRKLCSQTDNDPHQFDTVLVSAFSPQPYTLPLYSNRFLSHNIEPLIIKEITATTSLLNQSNSIASPKENTESNVPNHLLTKPLQASGIPYLSDDKHTYIRLILQYPTKYNIQFPVGFKRRIKK